MIKGRGGSPTLCGQCGASEVFGLRSSIGGLCASQFTIDTGYGCCRSSNAAPNTKSHPKNACKNVITTTSRYLVLIEVISNFNVLKNFIIKYEQKLLTFLKYFVLQAITKDMY